VRKQVFILKHAEYQLFGDYGSMLHLSIVFYTIRN